MSKDVTTIKITIPPDTDEVVHIIRLDFPCGYNVAMTPNALRDIIQEESKRNWITVPENMEEFKRILTEKGLPHPK